MKKVMLNTGALAMVDDEDFDKVKLIPWSENRSAHSSTSYAHARINKIPTYMHRFILDAKKGDVVDHINHDGLDNRRENLRLVSHQLNMFNRRGKEIATSKYLGVFKQNGRRKFRAFVQIPTVGRVYLGSYSTEVTAAKARNDYILKYNIKDNPLNDLSLSDSNPYPS